MCLIKWKASFKKGDQMKKILITCVICLSFVLLNTQDLTNDIKLEKRHVHALYAYDVPKEEMFDVYDFAFIAKINDLEKISNSYNDHFYSPITFFNINVIHTFKGALNENEVIKFFGGYDQDGVMVVFEDMVYPVEGEYYLIFANEPSYEQTDRHIAGSFSIHHDSMMIHLENFLDGYDMQHQPVSIHQLLTEYLYTSSFQIIEDPNQLIDAGGSPENPTINDSIEQAIEITADTIIPVTLSINESRWYKIIAPSSDSFTIYSTMTTDFVPMVQVYDSSGVHRGFGQTNFNASSSNILESYALSITEDPNFLLTSYFVQGETYYIRIRTLPNATEGGTLQFRFFKDNVMLANYSTIYQRQTSVKTDKKLYYKNLSSYPDEVFLAPQMYNEMGNVQIIQQTGGPHTRTDLLIYDYHLGDNNIIGIYNQWNHAIGLNVFYLDQQQYVSRRMNVVLHEFGHALGLGHMPKGNIMYYTLTGQRYFGPTDVAAYRMRW